MSKPSILVIDDDPKEIERTRTYLSNWFIIGGGQSIEDATADLAKHGGKRSRFALVDMYYPDRVPTESERTALHVARAHYLHAQETYGSALARLGQSSTRGFQVAKDITARWPKVGFAFFTRKGTLEDAVRAYEEVGAAAVIKKPDPPLADVDPEHPEKLDEAYDRQFHQMSGMLADRIRRAIRRSSFRGRYAGEIRGIFIAVVLAILAAIAVDLFKANAPTMPANQPVQPTGSAGS